MLQSKKKSADMRHRGKYMFWTLVAVNCFMVFVLLRSSIPQNTEDCVTFPPEIDECLQECYQETLLPEYVQELPESEEHNVNISAFINQTESTTLQTTTENSQNEAQLINLSTKPTLSPLPIHPWQECPKPGLGRKSTFLTCFVDGRLGNVVLNYLSLWAGAIRYNLRPFMDRPALEFLYRIFDKSAMKIPMVEEMDEKCNTGDFYTQLLLNASANLLSRKNFFDLVERPPKSGFQVLKFSYFIFNTEDLVPYWNTLKEDLVFKQEFSSSAQNMLDLFLFSEMKRLNLDDMEVARETFEFVGIHARMTDYIHHMDAVYPGSSTASPQFYSLAMDWMTKTVEKPLIFVVVSDDVDWAKANIVDPRVNAFIAGNGDIENPGYDLALLAACNHTIFAYGTFGLIGALLASHPGSFHVIFDPLNGTVTKEMEFASNLPGWRIMDNDGNFNYENKIITYEYYVHPRMT